MLFDRGRSKIEDEDEDDWGTYGTPEEKAALHPSGSANRRRAYERKTTFWNAGSLRRRGDGHLSLVRWESTDSYPGDPQDGRDKFPRLLKTGRP
jgi:hypothetical protein